jgi:hypothetical protein
MTRFMEPTVHYDKYGNTSDGMAGQVIRRGDEQLVGQAHRLPGADVNRKARGWAGEAPALQLLFRVELEPVRPILPLFDKARANGVLLDVKPFLVKRLIGA